MDRFISKTGLRIVICLQTVDTGYEFAVVYSNKLRKIIHFNCSGRVTLLSVLMSKIRQFVGI